MFPNPTAEPIAANKNIVLEDHLALIYWMFGFEYIKLTCQNTWFFALLTVLITTLTIFLPTYVDIGRNYLNLINHPILYKQLLYT